MSTTLTFRNRLGDLIGIPTVQASDAKTGFGDLLEKAQRNGAVAITRHNTAKAVLISIEEFEALQAARQSTVDLVDAEFQGMLKQMQTPEAKKGAKAAFAATPEELGKAAVKMARRPAKR